ncbi:hypothetical protein GCM10007874_32250 [Labrys miyagiensis]|uniref:Gfo/Idh/MocA-like oxidoreductase C-terminal domain-containing protein n=2 Tax=Labrys miyagiensis TaxID=346912 RepID=A0ABQ6CIM2_9HYPH|nr:hypothetical protein GCM10007874_32250 [Labrys miyagiensis]
MVGGGTGSPPGEAPRVVTRASPEVRVDGAYATGVPPGHPEAWIEGFAQIYRDTAEQIRVRQQGRRPDPRACLVPTVEDREQGLRFVEAAVASHQEGGLWESL